MCDGNRTRYYLHHKQAPRYPASHTVPLAGLEPATSALSERRANQLRYKGLANFLDD